MPLLLLVALHVHVLPLTFARCVLAASHVGAVLCIAAGGGLQGQVHAGRAQDQAGPPGRGLSRHVLPHVAAGEVEVAQAGRPGLGWAVSLGWAGMGNGRAEGWVMVMPVRRAYGPYAVRQVASGAVSVGKELCRGRQKGSCAMPGPIGSELGPRLGTATVCH